MTDKHTPLPWRATRNKSIMRSMPPKETRQVHNIATLRRFDKTAEEANGNAEFIVKACNSHYELVETLERWVHNYELSQATGWEPLLEQTQQALNKAKGVGE